MANQKFYSDVQIKSDIIIDNATTGTVPVIDGSKKLKSSTVTTTELGQLSGVTSPIQTQLNSEASARAAADALLIPLAQKGAINGVATLDAGGKVPVTQLPNSVMEYQGAWNASTNSPALVDGTGNAGDVYRTSVAGSQTFGSVLYSFGIGDFIIYSGSVWQKAPASDAVLSVFGRQGNVTAQTGDYNSDQVTEGSTNLFFNTERAQDAVGAALANTSTVNLTYNDAGNAITADARTQLSITSDVSGLKLSGDAATPGNTRYYGTDGTGTKGFFAIPTQGSAGDIQETSFNMANNVASLTNITGFAFSNTVVRSFDALVSVEISATSSVYEVFKLTGIKRGADWAMTINSTGDSSLVSFDITAAGQVQYTSGNNAGFTSGKIKFRAIVTSF